MKFLVSFSAGDLGLAGKSPETFEPEMLSCGGETSAKLQASLAASQGLHLRAAHGVSEPLALANDLEFPILLACGSFARWEAARGLGEIQADMWRTRQRKNGKKDPVSASCSVESFVKVLRLSGHCGLR